MAADVQTNPRVSILTATYNRANVLRFAIESAIRSTFADWELLVIGDACTDDTGEVVASFDDPRIRFVNLEENFGEQSGPNNFGFGLSRGRYIAYLNHDDLYFPDHLETSLATLEQTGADLVFAAMAIAAPRDLPALERGEWQFKATGVSPTGRYEPFVAAPASSWLLRRELIDSVGPWRPATECYVAASQDFLFRAWKAGRCLRAKPHLTVLALQSGHRKNVYANREDHENRFYARILAEDPTFRERVLSSIAMEAVGRIGALKMRWGVKRAVRRLIYGAHLWLGLHPKTLRSLLKFGRKGSFIDHLRRTRGLEPIRR